jgi:hypothetical protein
VHVFHLDTTPLIIVILALAPFASGGHRADESRQRVSRRETPVSSSGSKSPAGQPPSAGFEAALALDRVR